MPDNTEDRSLEGYLRDWQGLVRGHVHQAQQIVRRLVKGRLTLVPQADGHYTFTGVGTVQPLLGGIVRKLASLSIPSWNQIAGFLESMRQLREAAGFAA